MADAGKLWFEMGVRENVTNSLGAIIKEGQRAAGVIDELVMNVERMAKIDIMKHENGKALKDAQNYQQMLLRIDAKISEINAKQLGATVGIDKLQKAFDILNRFRAQLGKMEGNGDEWTGDMMAAQRRALSNAMTQVNQLLREQKSAQQQADQATRSAEASTRKKEKADRDAARAAQENSRANENLINTYQRLVEQQQRSNRFFEDFKNYMGIYTSFYGIKSLLNQLIQVGGEFEVQHVALQNILGDVQAANQMFSQIKSLAIVSPFSFRQLATYTKQTAAFGIPQEELYGTVKMLADLSAGLGVDMQRLILAYGQVRSAAVLRGQELRQFTEAGIPMVQALADKFTVLNGKLTTTADVFELISKRQVPFEMVDEVLRDLTGEGGRFYNMQYKLSDTLAGKWSNLKDAWEIMLSDFANSGSVAGSTLKMLVGGATDLLRLFRELQPIMFGIGGAWAGRAIFGGMKNAFVNLRSFGASKVTNTFLEAKEMEAQKLIQKQLLYGEEALNQKEKEIIANKRIITTEEYKILAANKQLNAAQLNYLYKSKQIDGILLSQLRVEKLITEEEYKRARFGRTPWQTAAAGVGGFLKNYGVFAGITAALSVFSAIKSKSDEINADVEGTFDMITQKYDSVIKAQEELSAKGTSQEELRNQVKQMQDVLQEVLPYYNGEIKIFGEKSVKEEVDAISDLSEKYDYLKGKLDQVASSYELVEQQRNAVKNAEEAGGGMWSSWENFSTGDWDSLKTDMKDWDETKAKISAELGEMNKGKNIILKNINEIIPAIKTEGRAFSEIMADVAEEGSKLTTKITNNLKNIDEKLAWHFAMYLNWTQKLDRNLSDVYQDAKKEADSYRNQMEAQGWDFKSDEQIMAVKEFVHNTVQQYAEGSEEIKRRVEGMMLKAILHVDVQLDFSSANNNVDLSDFAGQVWSKFGGDPNKKGANETVVINGKKVTRKQIQTTYPDNTKGRQVVGQKIQNAKKRIDQANYISDATMRASEKAAAAEEYAAAMAEWIWSDDPLSMLKSGLHKAGKKGGGGSKKDEALERAKTELDSIKNFLAEFKKYKEVYGREKSLSLLEEIFKLPKGRGKEIVDDYKGQLKKLLDALPLTSEARKKFGISVNKLIADFDLDQAKEDIQKALKQIERIIQEETNQWNLYKSLLEKTGSKDFAMSAFVDGIKWDDMTRSMAAHLREAMNGQNKVMGEGIWDIDEDQAEEFFGKGTAELKQWQEIVKNIRKNWTDSLNEIAEATAALLTDDEKIVKLEQEIADLRKKDASRVVILKKMLDLEKARTEAFKHSSEYLKFYESILSMTIPEAEEIGQKIRRNLNQELKMGTITAKQYTQEVKRINDQMKKLREHATGLRALIDGGLNGLFQGQYDRAESNFNSASIDYQKAAEAYQTALKNGDDAGAKQAQSAMKAAEAMQDGAGAAMQGAQGAMNTVMIIDKIIHGINDAVQGIKGTFEEIKEMYDYMGKDTESGGWQDAGAFLNAFSSASQNATNAWDSLKNGNMGGVIQGVVGSFTSWYTGLAKGWDSKMDRQIQIAQRQLNATERLRSSMETLLSRTLGGVYAYSTSQKNIDALIEARNKTEKVDEKTYLERARGSVTKGLIWSSVGAILGGPVGAAIGGLFGNIFGAKTKKYIVNYYGEDTRAKMEEAIASQSYYDEQLALLYKQRDELNHQLESEKRKKKSDADKIEDYSAKIDEVSDKIKNFALDMAKALYEIDLQSWAKTLTDAIVGAWEKGENAVTAYRNAVKDMMKDLTTNILAKKVMERAFDNLGIDNLISQLMDATDGQLDEGAISKIAERLNEAGDLTANAITGVLDVLEAKGYIDKGDSSRSSSGANAIKSITEDQTNLLLSYINAMRADLSIHVERVRQMMEDVMPGMSGQFALQLAELKKIEANTHRSADGVEQIYSLLDSMSIGVKKLSVKAYA